MAKKNNEIEVAVTEVVDYMRVTGKFAPELSEVVQRKITVEAAKKSGIKASSKELQKVADSFRVVNDLNKASDTNKWLKSSGISLEYLEQYLETNLLISKFKDKLEKKTSKSKYQSSEGVKESIRDMIYQDWLESALK